MEIILGLTLVGVMLFLALVAPIVSWVRATRVEADLRRVHARLSAIEAQLRDSRALAAVDTMGVRPDATPAVPLTDVAVTGGGAASVPAALQAAGSDLGPPPPLVEPPTAAEPVVRPEPVVPPEAVAQPPGPLPSAPAAATTARVRDADAESALETAIGGRLLLYVGTVALVLGAAFFLKYAFDRNWINEWMRVGLGAAGGAALIVSGIRFTRRGYQLYGQMLVGGGLGVLYLAVYAAFGFYGLIGRPSAFTLFVLVTVAAAALADRQRSQPLAVMAVGAGFLTPFLVGGDTDAQVMLFSYVALLVAGTMVLAHRHGWPLLHVLSYALTVLTVVAWASEYYSRYVYLRTELFLALFCAMFLYIRHETRRSGSDAAVVSLVVLASAPVLFHLASIVILFGRSVALLVYLIAFSLVGVWWTIRTNRPAMRGLLWVAAMLPLVGWMAEHQRWTYVAPSLVTLGAIFVLYLVALFDRLVRHESALAADDLLLLHLNGLGTFFGAWVLLEDMALAWVPYAGLGLALVHVGTARQMRARDFTAALHALAVGFTLIAATVAVQLDGSWLTAAWAAEGAAVAWIGLRVGRTWFRAGGALLLVVAVFRWLGIHLQSTPADFHLVWNETFLLGAWIVVLLYVLAWAHRRVTPAAAAYRESLAALLVTANVLTVLMLTADAAAYWDQRGQTLSDATFARGLTLSLVWAFYAAILVVVGIRRHYAPIRYTAIALFGLTIGKVFLVDLAWLQGIYRVLGLMIVGAVLLGVSFLYQRAVATQAGARAGEATPPHE